MVNTLLFLTTTFGLTTREEFESVRWLCLEFDTINPFQTLAQRHIKQGAMEVDSEEW